MPAYDLECACGCGTFTAKSPRAKWARPGCKKRHQRRAAAPAPDDLDAPADQPCVCRGSRLVTTVVRDLEEAGRLDSAAGQIAVAYAVEATRPGATGVAGLLNGLRQALAEAIGTPPDPDDEQPEPEDEDDPVARAEDELARKRAALSAG